MHTTNDHPGRSLRQPSNVLTAEALDWLNGLPEELRPRELGIAYARIANTLQALWIDPRVCLSYLNDLLIDNRGGRQGFPFGILVEIATLKDFVDVQVNAKKTAWDLVVVRRD